MRNILFKKKKKKRENVNVIKKKTKKVREFSKLKDAKGTQQNVSPDSGLKGEML